jgi:C4-dicarboxylate transporter DctM subunit
MILTVLFGVMVITMILGMPIAWSLGLSGVVALVMMEIPLQLVPQKIFTGIDLYPLLCIPFFVFSGELMAHGGITERLLRFAVNIVGFVRGGLSLANVVASMLFGGITGAATADASALGSVEIPMMVRSGYDAKFSAAVTAASSCIGPIIPPSVVVVIYAMAVRGVSIGGMFAAGIIPGVLVGVALMVTCYIISVKRQYPKREEKISASEFLQSVRDAVLALVAPLIILGGIMGGVFTPTEAGAVAAVYSFVVTYFIYRELKLKDIPAMLLRSAMVSAIVIIIIGTSNIFGMVVAYEQLALKLQTLVEPLGYFGFLLAINIIFLAVGTFMDQNPAILILAPVFAPIASSLGIEPIHFGVIVITNLVIGLITPPMGQVLFVVAPIAGITFEEITKEIIVFILVEIAVLLLVTYVPPVCLTIPKLLGYI